MVLQYMRPRGRLLHTMVTSQGRAISVSGDYLCFALKCSLLCNKTFCQNNFRPEIQIEETTSDYGGGVKLCS